MNNFKYIENILSKAYKLASEQKSKFVLIEHVLYVGLTDDKIKKEIIKVNKKMYETIINVLHNHLTKFPLIERLKNDEDKIEISKIVMIFMYEFMTSCKCNENLVEDKNIFYMMNFLTSILINEGSYAEKILTSNGLDDEFIVSLYQKHAVDKMIHDRIRPMLDTESNNLNNNQEQEFLSKYTIDLTSQVGKKDWIQLIGREKELELLEQVLYRRDKPNAILIGNPGIGKTKIVEGLAWRYREINPNITILMLDLLSLMSNIFMKGELENRVKTLCTIIKNRGNTILFIDEIHSICNGGDSSSQSDVSNLLKPLMTDGSLKIIGATTFEEYRKYIEKDDAFTRRFYKLNVEDPTLDETRKVINAIAPRYAEFYNLTYTNESLETLLDLTNKYIFDRHFPDKAIDILDMSGAYCKHNKLKEITVDVVQKTISQSLGIPLSNISQSEEDIYQHLEERISEKIIGQDEAVSKVCDAVIISRSGLRESNKTATSLMFKGSPGVGKTEICKVLSETLNIPLVRFDMSEYMEEHSVPKLIGAPPGYKDAGNGKAGNGLLINAIDEHPYCILLLDEIEKAHSKIHNLLLQVMDNGKLTSSMGKSVSFENVFLIMTSNVGSGVSHKRKIGFGSYDDFSPSDQEYEDRFLPEFRNRIDSTVTFNNLPRNVLEKICVKFLNELKDILFTKKIDFNFNDDIISYIVDKIETKGSGARPIKHIITNEIKNVIAKKIVFGEYKENSTINLTIKDNIIDFGV